MSAELKSTETEMRRTALTAILLILFTACCLFSHSCANTSTPPSGGPKDTLPPVLLKITPEDRTTSFPVTEGKVTIVYDEYTVVKTATDIILSPPTRRRPIAKVKGKNIVVTLQDTLRENQTYTIDFGNALVDNNEGNLADRLVYTFSTGETIDSVYFTGSVSDNQTLQPVKGMLVAAYADRECSHPDSLCFTDYPDAAAKTDDWGFFTIRAVKSVPYRIYAYTDEDMDFRYNPDTDQIGFCDSLFTPEAVVRDSIYELKSFRMKDTIECKARVPMVTINTFKELQSVQYLQNSGRKTNKSAFLKFSAANVQINSIEFTGIDPDKVITQYNQTRDSLDFWFNVDYRLPDSLLIRLSYMKTDSTGNLSEAIENLSLPVKEDEAAASATLPGPAGKNKTKPARDTVFKLSVEVKNETVEKEGVRISCATPIVKIIQDSIVLKMANAKGQEFIKEYTMEKDPKDVRAYILKPKEAMVKGYDYSFSLPLRTFVNLDGLGNSKEEIKFQIPQSETLSTITVDVKDVDNVYIIDLTDAKNGNAVRTEKIDRDGKVVFKYLAAGEYKIRMTQDLNGNGYLDSGNLLERRQPEKVRFYGDTPETQVISIPESSEIEQTINIGELFR